MRYIKNYEKYKINEFFLWDSDDQSKIKNHFSEKGNLNSDEEILNAIDNDKMKGSDLTELTLHYLANNKDYKRLFNFVENMSKHFNYILDDIIEKEDKKIVDWFFKNMKDRKEDKCPKCESKSRLIFTTFNGHFKGDNFTKTTT